MKLLPVLSLALLPAAVAAEAPWTAAPAPALACVEAATAANLALRARTLDLDLAAERLVSARAALQPRLDVLARYSLADGGRTTDIPTGDLLNGVYRTLNGWLVSQGQSPSFPTINNVSIPFLRPHEQETKLRLTQPLYRPEITRGIRARRAQSEVTAASLAAFRRELRFSVLGAYYTWLQSDAAVGILHSALAVTDEALRVTRVLFDNSQTTEDRVLRAESDRLAVLQQLAEAERDRNSARSYVNFLLNRPLDAVVDPTPESEIAATARLLLGSPAPRDLDAARREELAALRAAVTAASAAEAVAEAARGPSVDLAVDAGLQGESYRTDRDARFVQGSVVAQFNVWDGRARRSEVAQARLARQRLEVELVEARQRLDLQVRQAVDDYAASSAALQAAERRRVAAARAFDLVAQREREGLVNQLTFLDARAELTRSELNRVITGQRLFTAAAALDRAAALSPLP